MFAHPPEISRKPVVKSRPPSGQRSLKAIGRIAIHAYYQVPLSVGMNPDEFPRRRSYLVLLVDAAALDAAVDIERDFIWIHADGNLVFGAPVGPPLDDLPPDIGFPAFKI